MKAKYSNLQSFLTVLFGHMFANITTFVTFVFRWFPVCSAYLKTCRLTMVRVGLTTTDPQPKTCIALLGELKVINAYFSNYTLRENSHVQIQYFGFNSTLLVMSLMVITLLVISLLVITLLVITLLVISLLVITLLVISLLVITLLVISLLVISLGFISLGYNSLGYISLGYISWLYISWL